MAELKTELKTLSKSDPEFKKYLLGDFSKVHRAIPIQSLNVATETETVTFKIVPVQEIVPPPFFQKWAQILKLKNFVLLAFPIFVLLVKNELDQVAVNANLALLNVFGCVSLLAAMNLRNDYRDHLSGLDRVHPESGSRAIQLGWLTALETKTKSTLFVILGAFFGLPALIAHPQLSFVLAVTFILVGLMEASYRSGLKYRWWTEVLVFFLFGPIFTWGFQMGIGIELDFESIFVGIISGWLSVFVIHIRNFEAIMVNDQAGFFNSVSSLGFERSKTLLWFWWFVLIFGMDLFHWYFAHDAWLVSFVFITLGLSLMMLKIIHSIKSPVASNFRPALDRAYRLTLILISLWVVENLSYLLMKEIG